MDQNTGSDTMPKVIIISQGNQYTGINKYAINTYKAMENNAELYFLKFRRTHGYYDVGIAVEGKFPYGNSIFNPNSVLPDLAYSRFIEFLKIKKKHEAVVHVSSPHVLRIAPGLDNVVTIHDVSPFLPGAGHNVEYAITKKFYRHYLKYEHVLTVSDHVKKAVIEMGAEGRVDRVYSYVSDSFVPTGNKGEIKKRYGLPHDKKLILSVSTNIPRKNLKILPDLLSKLGDEYRLVRIGEGVGNSYVFSPKDENQMNELYNACDLLISPSLDEGFGYPVVEALKAGLAVAISDIPVHREVAQDYGHYFDPMSVADAARAVKETFESYNSEYKRPDDLLSKFSLNNFKDEMTKYYASVSR